MEGVQVVGTGPGSLGTEIPSGVQGQSPGRVSGGRGPPKTETKCKITVQFLTFSCIEAWI